MKKINDLFFVNPEFHSSFLETQEIGIQEIQKYNITITGLCRNVEDKIQNFFDFIRTLEQSLNLNLNIFLYENDSTDNTVAALEKSSKDFKNFTYITEKLNYKSYGQTKEKDRTEKMAYYRNKCLEYVKRYDSDYTIVMDTDFIDFSVTGLINSFGWFKKNSDIHGMCGSSFEFKKSLYENRTLWNYDSWAYRENWWEDQDYSRTTSNPNPTLWFGFWIPIIGSEPKKVNSGFGGCCIYKTEYYNKGIYNGQDCEHVTFHKFLKDKHNFNLYLNPSQIMLLNVI